MIIKFKNKFVNHPIENHLKHILTKQWYNEDK